MTGVDAIDEQSHLLEVLNTAVRTDVCQPPVPLYANKTGVSSLDVDAGQRQKNT